MIYIINKNDHLLVTESNQDLNTVNYLAKLIDNYAFVNYAIDGVFTKGITIPLIKMIWPKDLTTSVGLKVDIMDLIQVSFWEEYLQCWQGNFKGEILELLKYYINKRNNQNSFPNCS